MGGDKGHRTATQTSLEYTSTKSIFTFDISGKVILTVTFFSPVYPDDLARQSLQFSYISIKAKSYGGSHKVQIYLDVSGGEWFRREKLLVLLVSLFFVPVANRRARIYRRYRP